MKETITGDKELFVPTGLLPAETSTSGEHTPRLFVLFLDTSRLTMY